MIYCKSNTLSIPDSEDFEKELAWFYDKEPGLITAGRKTTGSAICLQLVRDFGYGGLQ